MALSSVESSNTQTQRCEKVLYKVLLVGKGEKDGIWGGGATAHHQPFQRASQ